ncbi:MAG: hypothetical protein Q4E53_10145 [Eubacteriales bacterium]|nr:hypothetical protein [Eubacteriales bacterium]
MRKDRVNLSQIREEIHPVLDENGKKVWKPAYFAGMKTLIHGAFSFVSFFEKMHQEGKVFASNDPTGFLFDLKSGEMDFIMAELFEELSETGDVIKEDKEILEISEFAAPELLEAYEKDEKLHFNVETDRYFMAVFLFEYFFHTGSPFEGKMMVNRCFLSPLEKEMFRVDQGIFCMDSGEHDNQPVKGIQDKLIRYWNAYPTALQKSFMRAFFHGGTSPEFRPSAVDWMQLLVQLTMDYKECSGCEFHGFSFRLEQQANGTRICPKCGKIYYPLTNGMDTIWLAQGQKLYECQTGKAPFHKEEVTGIVVENRQRKGLYGIKNVSQGVWRGVFPDNSTKDIGQDQGIPIWNGMRIRFETGEDWFLRLNHTEMIENDLDELKTETADPDRQQLNEQ